MPPVQVGEAWRYARAGDIAKSMLPTVLAYITFRRLAGRSQSPVVRQAILGFAAVLTAGCLGPKLRGFRKPKGPVLCSGADAYWQPCFRVRNPVAMPFVPA